MTKLNAPFCYPVNYYLGFPRHSAFGFRHSLNVRVIRGIRGAPLLPPSCPFACHAVALREGGWLAPKNRKNFACSRGSKSNTSS